MALILWNNLVTLGGIVSKLCLNKTEPLKLMAIEYIIWYYLNCCNLFIWPHNFKLEWFSVLYYNLIYLFKLESIAEMSIKKKVYEII